MLAALHNLNYMHVIVVAIIGFLVGFVWYSMLFGKAWMAEMKISPDAERPSMAPSMIKGFICTLVSTWGLALLISAHGTTQWVNGGLLGAMVGLVIVGARFKNLGIWERKSCKLLAINIGHEFVMFAIQGAILGIWR